MKLRFKQLLALINIFEHDSVKKNLINFDNVEELVKQITIIAKNH